MKSLKTVGIVLCLIALSGCIVQEKSDSNIDVYNTNISPIIEEAILPESLAQSAAEIMEKRIFTGCIVGIMSGEDEIYSQKVTEEFAKKIKKMGYSIGVYGESTESDVLLFCTEGDEEGAAALLTHNKVVLIICCDMESTECLLYSDNEYSVVGETIAAIGMNETECHKIEHR